jgi:hypothetical protein
MAILNNSNAITTTGGYDVNNSLRFRASASASLTRTPASAGNRTKWTYSAWVKRGVLGTSNQTLLAADTNSGAGATSSYVWFTSSDTLAISIAAGTYYLNSSSVYRDPSAWYHIVAVYDTTQATSSNRLKLYVNGVQLTAFGTATYPTLNYASNINNNVLHAISARVYQSPTIDTYFDGYVAETNFIDGQALTPSSFGETDTTTGVWKPKAYSGSYGTNGFYLKFSDIATTSGSNAGLGKDFSGNTNYWTTNNISVTSGTTYDAMKDSPTNTSATVANYCTWNPVDSLGTTTSGANLNAVYNASGYAIRGTMAYPSTGKWYYEMTQSGTGDNFIGLSPLSATLSNLSSASSGLYAYYSGGFKYTNGASASYGATFTNGDVIGVAVDADAGTVTFYKNNVSQGTAFTGLDFTLGWQPLARVSGSGVTAQANFGQRPFAYTPPTGFVALNTYNLPTPTILQGNKYMDATLYTGNSGTQTVANAAGFAPDLVWLKMRTTTGENYVWDRVRGGGSALDLVTNRTNAEGFNSAYHNFAFASNGFTVTQIPPGNEVNYSGNTYVGWQWQAGQGSTSSNTQGSITSTVSVNTTAGFSVVTYTGNGTTGATVGHGLGVTPAMVIVKNRQSGSVENWAVWQKTLASQSYFLNLSTTDAVITSLSNRWTAFSSTTITLGNNSQTNASSNAYVAYCWAEIAGFSKFGSYTGNGSTDGPFVYLGFRPKFIVIKSSSNAAYWIIEDSTRNPSNVVNLELFPNDSLAETNASRSVDFLSNGFKLRHTDITQNGSGYTYIYAAFAENPFSSNNRAR